MSEAQSFGQWLKARRQALDLTREDLAEQVGCASVTITKIERGQRRPSRQVAECIVSALGISAEEHAHLVQWARGNRDAVLPQAPAQSPPRRGRTVAPILPEPAQLDNLPAAINSFVGREGEVQQVRNMLRRADVRLLTLTGPPGIGKTRLSVTVAAASQDDFEHGVWFVPLAPIENPDLVLPTIAQTIVPKEAPTQAKEGMLQSYLRDKRLLLVLDNLEQVLDVAPLLSELLAAAPNVKALVTSRSPLHIYGEHEFTVQPLALPDLAALPQSSALSENPAVALFVQRAQAVMPDFQLTPENAAAVAQICVGLDGLPLAIELAAARNKLFTPTTMLEKLAGEQTSAPLLDLLAAGPRDRTDRQRTLRGALDWRYRLLDENEQMLFRRLSVFVGGHTLEAAEAVCDAGDGLHLNVMEGVLSLVEKSLLQQPEGPRGESRFWMLETIHEYAREKLAEGDSNNAGEAASLQREHALYYMSLVEEAERHLLGSGQAEWLDSLEGEHDNLRAALRWAKEGAQRERIEIGLRTAGALWRFWTVRGHYKEGRAWLSELLELAELPMPEGGIAQGQSQLRAYKAKALHAAGLLAWRQGDLPTARAFYERGLMLFREIEDKAGISSSLNNLGNVAREQGDLSNARSLYEESLHLRRELGDNRGVSSSLNNLGNVAREQGDLTTAHFLFEEGLALDREIVDKRGISSSLNNLGLVAHEQGDLSAARALYEESLAIFREIGDKRGIATSLGNLGLLALGSGDFASARSLYETSLLLRKEIGDARGIALSLAGMGGVAVEVAGKSVNNSDVARGARVLGAVGAMLESRGAVLDSDDRVPYERAVASARAQLGDEAFRKAWQEGRGMSIEAAIAYALDP